MKALMTLTAVALLSISTAAYACDGMKDHERSEDAQAKNDHAKDKTKAKADAPKPRQPESGATRS
jgi:hypothetical protein